VENILEHLPTVSVIIPNYNHEKFLNQRIVSVLNQTYQDFEIILLDDKSTDNSMSIINQYKDNPKVTKICVNDKNSGNVFRQWNKGIEMAQGKYVWIAESDDVASPYFLEVLVSLLDSHPDVGIAFSQSMIIDENGEEIEICRKFITDQEFPKWQQSYINSGKDELRHMVNKNTIPNASAVLFRKNDYLKAGMVDAGFIAVGDWITWVKILEISNIAFVSDCLNYFRRHQKEMTYHPDIVYLRRLVLERVNVVKYVGNILHENVQNYINEYVGLWIYYHFFIGKQGWLKTCFRFPPFAPVAKKIRYPLASVIFIANCKYNFIDKIKKKIYR
jgi:glycosyltransferase involved in cell wall biosynthesis